MTERLFIGGSADGRWISVDQRQSIVHVAKAMGLTIRVDVDPTLVSSESYRMQPGTLLGHNLVVYVHEDICRAGHWAILQELWRVLASDDAKRAVR